MNALVPARSVAQPCVHRVTARILLAAAALALSACGKQPPAPQAPQPPEVGVLKVEARATPLSVDIVGDIRAFREVELRPRVSGVIASLTLTGSSS